MSYLIIDVDLVLEPEFKNENQISILCPSKVVLKQFGYTQIKYHSFGGKNNISVEPEMIEKLTVSICNEFKTFTFNILGGGCFSINAQEGFLLIPDNKITVDGQAFFAPSKERFDFNNKYFKNDFLDIFNC